jgi:hypothetical protein
MGPWLVAVAERDELQPLVDEELTASDGRVLMLVRGDDAVVREFLPNALDAAKLDPGRRVIWIKDEAVLSDEERARLFQDDPTILAAVIAGRPGVCAWVYRDQIEVSDATFAFTRAASD